MPKLGLIQMSNDFDIFSILKNIDENNFSYFETLAPEQQTKVSFYMLLKWMACSNDSDKLLLLNATANKNLFSLTKYPKLIYHLFSAMGTGSPEYYKWKKAKNNISTKPKTVEVLQKFYSISTNEAIELSKLISVDDAVEMAHDVGYNDIKSIKKEF